MQDQITPLAPFIPDRRPPPQVAVEHRADGTLLLTHPEPLEPSPRSIVVHLEAAAAAHPSRDFLCQRVGGGDWRRLTYGAALAQVRAVAQWLAARGLGQDHHVMILSENSLEHAVLTFGCLRAGVPVVPVSPAYSLMSQDFARLHYVHDLIRPDLVFVQCGRRFGPALAALGLSGERVTAAENPPPGTLPPGTLPFERLLETAPGPEEAAAFAAVTPEMTAKILFTSGTTGLPKGVINTQGNITAAQQQVFQVSEPLDEAEERVLLDWLPWHHTFGGNAVINSVVRSAATLYIDDGRPIPGRFEETIRNLREIQPTSMSSVPAAYQMLADLFDREPDLGARVLGRVRSLAYGGAALPQEICDRLYRQAARLTGRRVPFASGWGMTETTATGFAVYWQSERVGMLGLPQPGTTVKLVPSGPRFEVRIKGPQVMPGYFRDAARTAEAFDEEGFFRTGDAVEWTDPDDPRQGLVFRGRVTEDFKLTSGTFVNAGAVRLRVLSELQPLVREGVITGQDRAYVGMLGWPNEAVCRQLCPDLPADAPLPQVLAHANVSAAVREALHRYNLAHPASSERVARFAFLLAPPSFDKGEVTDKQSINQRACMNNRASDIDALYTDPPTPTTLVV